MSPKVLLFIFAYLQNVTLSCIINSSPQDVTVILGSTAVFNCTGEGDQLQWTHGGEPINEGIVHHNVSDGMVSSSLYINATLNNDGVTIACLVLDPGFDSAGAVLIVRRISPVESLSLSIDDVPYVTWTIPSVIATDIPVSDIRYKVTLEGGNITSTVNDIDDTYYQFTDITVLNCTVYTATVTAYDVNNRDVYQSDIAMAEDSIVDPSKDFNNHRNSRYLFSYM